MDYKYAALAIPAFFLFLWLEYLLAINKNRREIFNYESSVANISIGIAERLLNLFISVGFYKLFDYIHDNFSLFKIGNTWEVWMILILTTDLVWYWYHRLGHEINILWGAHIVHHQSEEFNYTVSARITTIQAVARNIFWCILPLIGFEATMVISILVVHGAYSFFTHTQLVKMPVWFEYIFVSPSIHGVHHASNEKYLNKNYGDLFVFWDKLFGTYQKEDEKPVYGLTHPLKSYSFVWQHFHYYFELIEACRNSPGLISKLKILFGNPDVLDQNIRPALEARFLSQNALVNSRLRFRPYLNIQLIAVLSLLMIITYFFSDLGAVEKGFGTAFILITLINCGALLEQRTWIYYLEIIRVLILVGYLSILFETSIPLVGSAMIFSVLAVTESVKKLYLDIVYTSEN